MDWQNPGPHVTIADNLTDTQIANIQEEYKARKTVWDFQSNVNRAIIASLNLADTHTYCWVVAGAIGMRNYRFTDDPKDIVQVLQDNCGQMKPAEKTKIEADWSAAWNPLEPIKLLFNQLGGLLYVVSRCKTGLHTGEDDKQGAHRNPTHGTIYHRHFGIPIVPHGKPKMGGIQTPLR